MDAHSIMADRYNKFRNLGDYAEFLVGPPDIKRKVAERAAAPGVMTKTGRMAAVRVRPMSVMCQVLSWEVWQSCQRFTPDCLSLPGLERKTGRKAALHAMSRAGFGSDTSLR